MKSDIQKNTCTPSSRMSFPQRRPQLQGGTREGPSPTRHMANWNTNQGCELVVSISATSKDSAFLLLACLPIFEAWCGAIANSVVLR